VHSSQKSQSSPNYNSCSSINVVDPARERFICSGNYYKTTDLNFFLYPVCMNVLRYYNVRLIQHIFFIIYFYF
jgi:hypothetical protein